MAGTEVKRFWKENYLFIGKGFGVGDGEQASEAGCQSTLAIKVEHGMCYAALMR